MLPAAAACGGEPTPETLTPAPELPGNAVDIAPEDDIEPSVEDVSASSPAGPERGDAEDNAYQNFLDALDRELSASCTCRFAELGHVSPEVCVESRRIPDFAKTCKLQAFQTYSGDIWRRYACLAEVRDMAATCIEDSACAAFDGCNAARDAARRNCGAFVYADVEFANLDTSCQRNLRLGMPSGCPDVQSLGSALGVQVLTGDSTGAGDDVTLSCHQDFDGFESADVLVEWQAPSAGLYRFGTENSAFVTQIAVLEGCGGAELACASSSGDTYGGAEVSLSLSAQERVILVIEGYSVTDSGYYVLSVTQLP